MSNTLIAKTLRELDQAAALGEGQNLYDANKAVYRLLRYGVKVKKGAGQQNQTVWLIDWKHPENNHFAIAEEVTIKGENKKRPDIVLYVNGIALGILELKRSSVAIGEGIRQNLDNQKKTFIRPFFTTLQLDIQRREGGIIWHTQGSGKSLTMVWLAKWIRENFTYARVLIITDRTKLDEQIEKVFKGVDEDIYRTKSGADLLTILNQTIPWLSCSSDSNKATDEFIQDLKTQLPSNFTPKGDLFVFVDECHCTQSGKLHDAMKAILPNATFVGFTGTPLLKQDKQKSIEVFGSYIHTYKFDEAVADGVVLDLRYEARDIDQHLTSQQKIDQWFEAKTRGLSDIAKVQLKQKWGTMQKVLSS